MSDELDDLDALFDEISAQSVTTNITDPPPALMMVEMMESTTLAR